MDNIDACRVRVYVRGAVQGVGFRPYIYRLAEELKLKGWVINNSQGVIIEAEGYSEALDEFIERIPIEKPPLSIIDDFSCISLEPSGYTTFEVRRSDSSGEKNAYVLPDIATCPDCLEDIRDPSNRRYRYPFTNCTNCGPRFSIIESLPYDRCNTTMKKFPMCPECRSEYGDPSNRRFHAQPNACPECGPSLQLWNSDGVVLCDRDEALKATTESIKLGRIAAVKGLGGFHLMVDARSEDAVVRLRERKMREEKPLAVMYPSIDDISQDCVMSNEEKNLLFSPASPIVLLKRSDSKENRIAESVSLNNPNLGVMLPYTPLHQLLLDDLGFPVVATSGNISDEPICIDENEALQRLNGIADVYLVHDRPIRRHVDDSVARVILGEPQVLRRARGFAPLPVRLGTDGPTVLAVGGHLKNTVALSHGKDVFISQHLGDLVTSQACDAFGLITVDLPELYDSHPEMTTCDLHPDYFSTRYAFNNDHKPVQVQHHYAHILSCMAENHLVEPVLGVAWDGTGYGPDSTIWGGEFLFVYEGGYERVAHLRTFRLPGGDKAVREPRRAALGMLYELYSDSIFGLPGLNTLNAFTNGETGSLRKMLSCGLNSPVTSSAGRLFDAVASILGLRQISAFEGQAAMELEFAISGVQIDDTYDFRFAESLSGSIVDWELMIEGIIDDVHGGSASAFISAKFHNTLAEIIVHVARMAGVKDVALSGGCFQNKYLTERTVGRLVENSFEPHIQREVPPNDGGISLGQVAAVYRGFHKEKSNVSRSTWKSVEH